MEPGNSGLHSCCTQLEPPASHLLPTWGHTRQTCLPQQSLRVYRVSSGRQISPVRLLLMFPFCRLGTQETLWVGGGGIAVPLSPGSSAQIPAHPMLKASPATSVTGNRIWVAGGQKSLGGRVWRWGPGCESSIVHGRAREKKRKRNLAIRPANRTKCHFQLLLSDLWDPRSRLSAPLLPSCFS